MVSNLGEPTYTGKESKKLPLDFQACCHKVRKSNSEKLNKFSKTKRIFSK